MNYDDLDPAAYENRHERSPREAYMHQHWTPRYLAAFREVAHGRVLELGCGSGAYTPALAGAERVVGIDLSQRFLTRAGARAPFATFARADAHCLPFADASFDAVVSIGIFEYLDRARAFREISRVLVPSGRLVFAVPNRHSPFRAAARAVRYLAGQRSGCDEPTRAEIEARCADHGLAIDDLEMSDTLVWFPDVLDRRFGTTVYHWLGRSLARWPKERLSSVMLVRAHRVP